MEQVAAPVGTSGSRGLSTVASVVLIGLAVLEFALWLPQYLTWPWWADHDVFATMALGWNAGLRPYRDLVGNNFPGTIYFFWIVGRLAGWGNVVAYNAFDATLFGVLGLTTLLWGRRRFGVWLPGAVTLFTLVTYYIDLDFSMVAQRDWHAALFVALALIVLEVIPGKAGLVASPVLAAIGFSVRPQVLMFLPGLLWGAWTTETSPKNPGGFRRSAFWLGGFAGAVALLFCPLLREGLVTDLLQGFTSVIPGTTYNEPKGLQLLQIGLRIGAKGRVWALLPVLAILWPLARSRTQRSAIGWSLLLAGAVAYMAITPLMRPYVTHAFWLIWAFTLGVAVAMVREEAVARPWPWQAGAVSLLGLAMTLDVGSVPSTCRLSLQMPALRALAGNRPVAKAPVGYKHPYEGTVVLPPWSDYQATLEYLKTELAPSTRVANALNGVAINGPTGRLPALPSESLTWLFVVRPTDEDRFIATLRANPDSVVVWDPEAAGATSVPAQFPRLAETIRTLYEPAARFGPIAIWRRKVKPLTALLQKDRWLDAPRTWHHPVTDRGEHGQPRIPETNGDHGSNAELFPGHTFRHRTGELTRPDRTPVPGPDGREAVDRGLRRIRLDGVDSPAAGQEDGRISECLKASNRRSRPLEEMH